MELVEKACTGVWGLNLLAAAAFGFPEPAHALGVLLVFAAVFFLFAAPLHLLLGAGAWLSYRLERAAGGIRAARHALDRLLCAESALFWAAYWAMTLGLLPLTIRL
jgi:hypothetical protein